MFTMLKRPFVDCFYIQVTNISAFFSTAFDVKYFYKGKTKNLKSSLLGLHEYDRLCIPVTASSVHLKIAIFRALESKTILNIPIQGNINRCFRVAGTFEFPASVEVPCE